ncbi:MAG: DUF1194 domain-containing protein [Paracoccaceae bacterium]
MVPALAQAQGRQAVGLELVLLVDVSASVNDEEFRLQAGGLAAAFESAAVLAAIRTLAPRGMAVSVVQWADHAHQRTAVDWTVLHRDADALWFAERIASMPRLIHGGHTAIGNALGFALNEIQSNRYAGLRRVIDVSGDGRVNDGLPLRTARREVLGHSITINGLAILNELPQLGKYFRSHLIGGEGAFVMTAQDYTDFATAMRHKLEQEIGSVPLTENTAPGAFIEARAEWARQFHAAFEPAE